MHNLKVLHAYMPAGCYHIAVVIHVVPFKRQAQAVPTLPLRILALTPRSRLFNGRLRCLCMRVS
jgi:hypothetical protein